MFPRNCQRLGKSGWALELQFWSDFLPAEILGISCSLNEISVEVFLFVLLVCLCACFATDVESSSAERQNCDICKSSYPLWSVGFQKTESWHLGTGTYLSKKDDPWLTWNELLSHL